MTGTAALDRSSTGTRAPTDADVVVVGAGPTGLLLAGDLAGAGLRVTLVERRPRTTGNLTRAFAVHARTLELLDARGLADELIGTGPALTRLRLFGSASLDLSGLRSRFPFLLVTPQYEVERLLERRAVAAGVEFRHGTALRALRRDAGGVTAELVPAGRGGRDDGSGTDGAAVRLRARYLVGADGVRSTVREQLGLPFPGRSVIRSVVLADVRLAEPPREVPMVDGTGDAFAFIAPFGDGWYRVMGWDRHHQVPDGTPVGPDEVRDIARRALGSDFGMGEARWTSRFHSDERQVPAYRVGRVLLAGDAAHVHSPAGGQGMNTGLQDAANLSWKLAAVLRGDTDDPEALLDSYHAERHPVGAAVLRSSGAIIRLATARTPLRRAARAAVSRLAGTAGPLSARVTGMISGIGVSYAAARGAHRLTGRRAPDLSLVEGRLYELLREGAFVLVAPRGAEPSAPEIATAPGRVIRATWANADRQGALLVRPDGHVAWARD
ncbi:FAD-dependent monooxygenase [Streptomyces somaliensis]|uniref:FAD-dependent oxidoreductase n=1 Tax=Streptomyces somaliensis TaxID=78355 RepID=UPI0020CDC0F4|nr:FAD-dependent oxidoreductase [Streptomyces somaliensis]MCP9945075.1 FAD-dependent monooxygenase [Streptomyces somaliensis]MCP9961709.1 FAD-dependent monooxygenase [Streptomyces somaliensis]